MEDLIAADLEIFCQGIKQFNERQFFQCHETLEGLWSRQTGEEKQLTQGLIQMAVAYHHLLAGNSQGALKLFKRALKRLEIYQPRALGLELAELCFLIRANIKQLESGANDGVDSVAIVVLKGPCARMPDARGGNLPSS